jgi:hypothetical protein
MLRRGLSLLLALLLLCVGWSGAARASVFVQEAADTVVVLSEDRHCCPELPATAVETVEPAGLVELAELLFLPVDLNTTGFGIGVHLRPHPVLETGHPTPCLAGLLRPPSHAA